MAKKAVEEEKVEVVKQSQQWPYVTMGVVGALVVLALAISIGHAIAVHRSADRHVGKFGLSEMRPGDKRVFLHESGHDDSNRIVHGVVTAINSDTLTVSGGGNQVSVKRSSETAVKGDKAEVAVNDTVAIVGEKNSDGVVEADVIVIRNNIGERSHRIERDVMPRI